MQITAFFVAALASGVSAKFGCGSAEPDAEHRAFSKLLGVQEERRGGNFTERAPISVGVYFHVVASSQTVAGGYLTDKHLADQLAVLNQDYAPHQISFRLLGTDRTVNTGWARDSNEIAMKTALRKGTYKDLNLYFQPQLGPNDYLGYAYFPTTAAVGSTAYIRDGASVQSQTVPGGSNAPYNLGRTATHEVGHWLGLYHTFQGGCTGSGDSIADTPAQASFSTGCPIGRDSCPNAAGVDPIHNYMDYSDDSCYEEFTPGQEARINSFWTNFRA
ncbi:metalloprotease [Plectosphaerella plurivora]|uniref:Metalloprotease n=1 Tax=Plectosphaerella plurivora TaxID=936078 RepID=A0A9P8VFA1_9PEZI|nr:metalloprotease [Plectosphaerella plurivora]